MNISKQENYNSMAKISKFRIFMKIPSILIIIQIITII